MNTWDGNTLDMLSEESLETFEGQTGISVNGSFINVEEGTNLPKKVVDVAKQMGFGKFNVTLNGKTIDPQDAPSEFESGDVVEISKYDTAG